MSPLESKWWLQKLIINRYPISRRYQEYNLNSSVHRAKCQLRNSQFFPFFLPLRFPVNFESSRRRLAMIFKCERVWDRGDFRESVSLTGRRRSISDNQGIEPRPGRVRRTNREEGGKNRGHHGLPALRSTPRRYLPPPVRETPLLVLLLPSVKSSGAHINDY